MNTNFFGVNSSSPDHVLKLALQEAVKYMEIQTVYDSTVQCSSFYMQGGHLHRRHYSVLQCYDLFNSKGHMQGNK